MIAIAILREIQIQRLLGACDRASRGASPYTRGVRWVRGGCRCGRGRRGSDVGLAPGGWRR